MLNKLIRIITILGISFVLFISCQKENRSPGVRGKGDINIEPREVPYFDKIQLRMGAEVRVSKEIQGQKVKIETNENLMKYIKTEVEGSVLKIYTTRKILRSDELIVHIEANNTTSFDLISDGSIEVLDSISRTDLYVYQSGSGSIIFDRYLFCNSLQLTNSGSGEIKINDLYATTLKSQISGSGNIDVKGRTNISQIGNSGSGKFNASDLYTAKSIVQLSGSGDVKIRVSDWLESTISGSGNLYYKGNPSTINNTITGSGKVIKDS